MRHRSRHFPRVSTYLGEPCEHEYLYYTPARDGEGVVRWCNLEPSEVEEGGRWRGGKKHAVKPLGSLKRLTITTTTPCGRQSDGKAPPANHGLRQACAPAEASARRGARQIEASRWPPCAPTRPIASMHLSGLRTLVASIDQRGQCIGMHLRASLLFDAPLLAA